MLDIASLLKHFLHREGIDLYLVPESKPCARLNDGMVSLSEEMLTAEDVERLVTELVSGEAVAALRKAREYNTAVHWQNRARLRVNLYWQRNQPAAVIRHIHTRIPTLDGLKLPKVYTDLAMEKRGLVLVVGQTGAGKSTSLAAMIGHRNTHSAGHIITVEDPIEFMHAHNGCIVSQRDVGVDTLSLANALKNALQQSPDVVMIGEIRDADTMEQALNFAETGHLVLSSLHAANAYQAVERIANFFPETKHPQILSSLSLNLRGILAQRLMPGIKGKRIMANEILLNQGLMRSLIREGRIHELKDCIEKAQDTGMQGFDQALLKLFLNGDITEDTALAESDSPANLRLMLKPHEIRRRLSSLYELTPLSDSRPTPR